MQSRLRTWETHAISSLHTCSSSWLLGLRSQEHPEVYTLLLRTLFGNKLIIAATFFWTQIGFIEAILSTGQTWLAAFLLLDVAILILRFHIHGAKDKSGFENIDAFSRVLVLLNTIWVAMLCVLIATLLMAPNIRTIVIGTILCIGFQGYVTAQFAAFPRFARLMLMMMTAAMCAGFLLSPFPELFPLGFLVPAGGVAFGILMHHGHRTLLGSARGQHQSRQLSLRDALTGLPNRLMIRERLAVLSRQEEPAFAILCLDLDGFKAVNDRHGHAAGDCLLVRIADRLRAVARPEDTPGRIGGDEFVILMPGVDHATVAAIVEGVIAAVAGVYDLGSAVNARIGVSIGVALCPYDGTIPDALLSRADEALYDIKRQGKGTWKLASGVARSPSSSPAACIAAA